MTQSMKVRMNAQPETSSREISDSIAPNPPHSGIQMSTNTDTPASLSQFTGLTSLPLWNSLATTVTRADTPNAESSPVAPKGHDNQIIACPPVNSTGNWTS